VEQEEQHRVSRIFFLKSLVQLNYLLGKILKGSGVMIKEKIHVYGDEVSEEKEPITKEEPIPTVPEKVSVSELSKKKLYAGIIVVLIIGLAIGYAISSIPISAYRNQITNLQGQLQNLQQDYDDLQERYDALDTDYASLVTEYQGALKVPYTTIQEGDVVWAFRTLDGTIEKWSMPIDTYTYYVDKAKPLEYHYLTTNGDLFTIRKMELFVQPEFFSNVINDLTYRNTARDFVREVFNLRVQMAVYSEDITDTPQWSAETMTEGTGDCEDFAIQMGSLLVAGNEQAHYGMTVQMVYMDSNNPTNPQTVNHVLLYIIYEDETGEFIDSTSTDALSPWSRVIGWYYNL